MRELKLDSNMKQEEEDLEEEVLEEKADLGIGEILEEEAEILGIVEIEEIEEIIEITEILDIMIQGEVLMADFQGEIQEEKDLLSIVGSRLD